MPWRRNFKIASLYLAGLMDHDSAVVHITRPWIRGFALYCALDELNGFQAHKFNLHFTSLSYFNFLFTYNTATFLLSFFKILRNSCINMMQILQHELDRAIRMWTRQVGTLTITLSKKWKNFFIHSNLFILGDLEILVVVRHHWSKSMLVTLDQILWVMWDTKIP